MYKMAQRGYALKAYQYQVVFKRIPKKKISDTIVSSAINLLKRQLINNSLPIRMFQKYFKKRSGILCTINMNLSSQQLLLPSIRCSLSNRFFCTKIENFVFHPKLKSISENFAKLNKNSQIDDIVKIMNNFQLLELSPQEIQENSFFIQKIADQAIRHIPNIKNESQVMSFIHFLLMKDEQNQMVWNDLNSAIVNIISDCSIDTIFDITEFLRTNNKLNADLDNAICEYLESKLNSMNINYIPISILIIISSKLNKGETYKLTEPESFKTYEQLSQLTNESFSVICHIMFKYKYDFQNFLDAGKIIVQERMSTFTLLELSQVLSAFSFFIDDKAIIEEAEKMILDNKSKISVFECINFIQSYTIYGWNNELWDLFEQIIAKNVEDLFSDQIVIAVKSFCNTPIK